MLLCRGEEEKVVSNAGGKKERKGGRRDSVFIFLGFGGKRGKREKRTKGFWGEGGGEMGFSFSSSFFGNLLRCPLPLPPPPFLLNGQEFSSSLFLREILGCFPPFILLPIHFFASHPFPTKAPKKRKKQQQEWGLRFDNLQWA